MYCHFVGKMVANCPVLLFKMKYCIVMNVKQVFLIFLSYASTRVTDFYITYQKETK